ncbi:hypothetical protein SAMN04487773_0884 [Enterobacter sp. kpr-6]|uniref:hypothetical protein n=1 Tax=Enterobacter sp. kpr-6 TaxID=1761782 RepID=UPI0008F2C804|nr:hypothetical protein [Enterobacter sp. kpr-6]SFQ98931.1 hypothetical protein SAMN04487773_0884 [Enterobacter sp. kpr-6]
MTLPKFRDDLQVEANYSINQATEMVGKTVKSVQIGFQKTGAKVHQTEMLIITFTDDTQLAISTGSNVGNIMSQIQRSDSDKLKPADFHVDLDLTWKR